MIDMDIKFEGIDQALRSFEPKVVSRAASLALNETAKKANTAANQSIRKEQDWNIRAGDLRKKIKVSDKARTNSLKAVVSGQGRPISLAYFGPTQYRGRIKQTRTSGQRLKRRSSKKGVYVKIKKGQQTHLPSHFMAAVPAGRRGAFGSYHVGVFKRAGISRLPIIRRSVITPASIFGSRETRKAVDQVVDETFMSRFNHHLNRLG